MKMKLKNYILPFLSAALLTSCSEYDDPADRFTEMPDVKPVSNVFMAEFTGQSCPNCPNAHKEIEKWQELFGDHFICVSIHGDATMMAIPASAGGLGTEQGVELNKHFGIESWPNAVVDWKGGKLGSAYGKWLTALVGGMIVPTDLNLSATAKVSADNNNIEVTAKMRSDQAKPDAKFNVWLSEDNITKLQLMPNGRPDMNYVHNGVFRHALCGIDGEPVTITANVEASETRSVAIDPQWKPENMNAVVFVYTESKGVIAVVKTKVQTAATDAE